MNATESFAGAGGPETITVTLPRMEDYAEGFARIERMMQAAELAGELTAAEFGRWMEHGTAIRDSRPQGNGKAPGADVGKQNAQGA